jgi:hypothetical protein
MVSKKVENQTGSLTPDHGKSRFPCVQLVCDTSLESSQRGLQLWFRPHPNQGFAQEVMVPQNCKSPTLAISGLPFGSPGTKNHSDVTPAGRCKVYYMGEGGGFP